MSTKIQSKTTPGQVAGINAAGGMPATVPKGYVGRDLFHAANACIARLEAKASAKVKFIPNKP